MIVGRCQRVVIFDIDLFLPGRGFALGTFHGNTGIIQSVADRAHHILFLGGLEDVVILIIGADQIDAAIAALMGFAIAFMEQEKLQLRSHHRLHAHIFQPRDLLFQHGAGRVRHIFVGVMIFHVAHHHGGAIKPGNAAQSGHVRAHHIVAISGGP